VIYSAKIKNRIKGALRPEAHMGLYAAGQKEVKYLKKWEVDDEMENDQCPIHTVSSRRVAAV